MVGVYKASYVPVGDGVGGVDGTAEYRYTYDAEKVSKCFDCIVRMRQLYRRTIQYTI